MKNKKNNFFPWNNKKKMITYIVKLNIKNFKIKIVEIYSKSSNKNKLFRVFGYIGRKFGNYFRIIVLL